ncbi:MAG TPA: WD40 repeat domain-containing protein, partial [Leptospiraceae bacterium]|nr:WD40 repeat domain-containing protein [Leptospiraceae bacterium]
MKNLNIFLIIFLSACISEQKPPTAVLNPKKPPVVKKDPVKEKPAEKKEPTVDEDLAFLMLKTEVPDSGKSSFSEVRQFLLPEKKKVYQLIFSEDSSHLVLVTNFYIKKISLGSLEEVDTLYPRKLVDGGFTGVAFSPDLNRILAGSSWENTASIYDWSGK